MKNSKILMGIIFLFNCLNYLNCHLENVQKIMNKDKFI